MGKQLIRLNREHIYVYFETLGYEDLEAYLLSHKTIPDELKSEQMEVSGLSGMGKAKQYYLAYYEGENAQLIKSALIIDGLKNEVQWRLYYWEKKSKPSEYYYKGNIDYHKSGMSFYFPNKFSGWGRSACIIVYADNNLISKPLLLGVYSGFDRQGMPVSGELILQKMTSQEELDNLTRSTDNNLIISQYLKGKRMVVKGHMPYQLSDLSTQSPFAHLMEYHFGTYTGWVKNQHHEQYHLELSIQSPTANSRLTINGKSTYTGFFHVSHFGEILEGRFISLINESELKIIINEFNRSEKRMNGFLLGIDKHNRVLSGNITLLEKNNEIFRKPTSSKQMNKPLEFVAHQKDIAPYIGTYNITGKDIDLQLKIKPNERFHLISEYYHYEGQVHFFSNGIVSLSTNSSNGHPYFSQILLFFGRAKKFKSSQEWKGSWHRAVGENKVEVLEILVKR